MSELANWQDVLWKLPTALGWKWYALWGAFGLIAAWIMFIHMILRHEFSALLVARAIMSIGLLLIPLCILQSGFERWIIVPYSVGGFMSAVLIATKWCEREDKSVSVPTAILRWMGRGLEHAANFGWGPRDHSKREDAL